jgi:hypothetical protein
VVVGAYVGDVVDTLRTMLDHVSSRTTDRLVGCLVKNEAVPGFVHSKLSNCDGAVLTRQCEGVDAPDSDVSYEATGLALQRMKTDCDIPLGEDFKEL